MGNYDNEKQANCATTTLCVDYLSWRVKRAPAQTAATAVDASEAATEASAASRTIRSVVNRPCPPLTVPACVCCTVASPFLSSSIRLGLCTPLLSSASLKVIADVRQCCSLSVRTR